MNDFIWSTAAVIIFFISVLTIIITINYILEYWYITAPIFFAILIYSIRNSNK